MLVRYGVMEGNAVRFTIMEAWWSAPNGGKWYPLNVAEAFDGTKELSEKEFERRFPHLQAMPKAAFQTPGSRSVTPP